MYWVYSSSKKWSKWWRGYSVLIFLVDGSSAAACKCHDVSSLCGLLWKPDWPLLASLQKPAVSRGCLRRKVSSCRTMKIHSQSLLILSTMSWVRGIGRRISTSASAVAESSPTEDAHIFKSWRACKAKQNFSHSLQHGIGLTLALAPRSLLSWSQMSKSSPIPSS